MCLIQQGYFDFDVLLDDGDDVLELDDGELDDGVLEDGVLDVEDGFDMSLLLVEPVEALPFVMASNSARLSCPSLFLSALSKSMLEAPLLALPPDEAEPWVEPVLEPLLADPVVALGDFAELSDLFWLASAAYAGAVPRATRDRPRTKALNCIESLLYSGGERPDGGSCKMRGCAARRAFIAESVPVLLG